MRVILILLLFVSKISFSQISAVTSNGDEVILYKDGTWKYSSAKDSTKKEVETNKNKFIKNKESTFQVKSNVLSNVSVYINPKLWSFEKGNDGEEKEYNFKLKGKDAYGMVISERISVPVESLVEVAITNAQAAAPDITVIKQEYRVVNGVKVFFMQMDGTIQGIKFSYYGYYASSKSGSLQFLTYTAQNLLEEYKPDLENLLNGLVISEDK